MTTMPTPSFDKIGAAEAIGKGWGALKQDFWRFVPLGLIFMGITFAASMVSGCVPVVGAVAGAIFVVAALQAGLFKTVSERIDGQPLEYGHIFSAFKSRYWQSVMAYLVPNLAGLIPGVIGFMFGFGVPAIMRRVSTQQHMPQAFEHAKEIRPYEYSVAASSEEFPAELGIMFGVFGLIILILAIGITVLWLFFMFAGLEVWQHESGWEAAKASCRLVAQNFWKVLGFAILMWLIGLAAGILGFLGCCIGIFFTTPIFIAWNNLAIVFLWRGLTGQNIHAAEVPPVATAVPWAPPPSLQPPVSGPQEPQPPAAK